MWFKNGLKVPKLLAQGIALGNVGKNKAALKGQKLSISKLLPFQGDFVFCQHYPGRCPGLRAFGLSARPRLPLFRLVAHLFFNNGTNCRPGTLSTGMLEADYYKVFP